jgi:probable rRNA maturation factor
MAWGFRVWIRRSRPCRSQKSITENGRPACLTAGGREGQAFIRMPADVSFRGRGRCPVSLLTVQRRANRMLKALRLGDRQLSVLLCDGPFIRRLNRRYRGLDRVTDVLSFSMSEGQPLPFISPLLGDIVICAPRAARQAAARRAGVLEEVTLLLAHGLLHLLGLDHAGPAAEKRMTRAAARLAETATVPGGGSGRGSRHGDRGRR